MEKNYIIINTNNIKFYQLEAIFFKNKRGKIALIVKKH